MILTSVNDWDFLKFLDGPTGIRYNCYLNKLPLPETEKEKKKPKIFFRTKIDENFCINKERLLHCMS